MKTLRIIILLTLLSFSEASFAMEPQSSSSNDSALFVPKRAIVINGNPRKGSDLIAVLYDKTGLHFSDPNAPRFLFLDREGRVALGIGGYLKGTFNGDFKGSLPDGSSFNTFNIATPNDPARRQSISANVNRSKLLLQLVGRNATLGYFQLYIQTDFTGNGDTGYGLRLKQAWGKVKNVTVGLAHSTWVDGAAGTPVIDEAGPAGEATGRNILVRYGKSLGKGWSMAAGVEIPISSYITYTTNASTQAIKQRVPDIPVNFQYRWRSNHIRLSGLLRNLSYRDLTHNSNHIRTGWAVQLSGVQNIAKFLDIYYQGAYGRGYGRYIKSLEMNGFDLVYDTSEGRMKAPEICSFEIGATCQFTPNLLLATSYSQARTFGLRHLGGNTYRYSQYVSATALFNLLPDLRLGLEYLYGMRKNYDNSTGQANRIAAMMQYSF